MGLPCTVAGDAGGEEREHAVRHASVDQKQGSEQKAKAETRQYALHNNIPVQPARGDTSDGHGSGVENPEVGPSGHGGQHVDGIDEEHEAVGCGREDG